VNEESLAHWRAVAPKTNKQTNKHIVITDFDYNYIRRRNIK
jgi:hypothetical protein